MLGVQTGIELNMFVVVRIICVHSYKRTKFVKGIQRRRSDVVSCMAHFILRILHRYMELALFRRTILVFVFGPQIFTPVRMLLGSLPGN